MSWLDLHNQNLSVPQFDASDVDSLNVSGNPIESLDVLPYLPRLTRLDIANCRLISTFGISSLCLLQEVNLTGNSIHVLDGLDLNKRIVSILADQNEIHSVIVQRQSDLEQLSLSFNRLQGNLQGITGMPRLRMLRLDGNRITNISSLNGLPALEQLFVKQNLLQDAQLCLPRLQVLDVSENKITKVECYATCTSLITLKLNDNKVSSIHSRILGHLKHLDLRNNSIAARLSGSYRVAVLQCICDLDTLDDVPVTAAELRVAKSARGLAASVPIPPAKNPGRTPQNVPPRSDTFTRHAAEFDAVDVSKDG